MLLNYSKLQVEWGFYTLYICFCCFYLNVIYIFSFFFFFFFFFLTTMLLWSKCNRQLTSILGFVYATICGRYKEVNCI